MVWTKEDQEYLKRFGALVGEAKFSVTGEQVVDLYRGLMVLSKVNKFISDMLAEQTAPSPPPPPPPAEPMKKERKPRAKSGVKDEPAQ